MPPRHALRLVLALLLIATISLVICAPAFAQYLVRTEEDLEAHRSEVPDTIPPPAVAPLLHPGCGFHARVWHGQQVPGGGTLVTWASGTTAIVNASDRIAFHAQVAGSPRNQGIFTADSTSLTPIAIGCGGYLGSGDPGTGCGDSTPIGGTFSGFETGSLATPDLNDAGDVLFLADVHGGTSPRGLFLYRGATGAIEKVAAIGDVASGLPLAAIGPGSLNDRGEVVFLAASFPPGNATAFVAHWRDGTLRKVVAPGDPSPVGGSFKNLAWIGNLPPDGTYVPLSSVPDINDRGTMAFRATVFGGQAEGGLFVSRDGVHERYVAFTEPSPAGGQYFNFFAPILNNADQIAFVGEYRLDPWLSGWFVGRPGDWRKVVSIHQPIDGGEAWGIAVSHNPMQPFDDDGNLLVWVDVKFSETVFVPRMLLGHADGRLETLFKSGDPTPLGGTLGPINPWPSVHGRTCILDANVTGAGGIAGAHFQFLKRPMEVTGLAVARDQAPGVRLTWDLQYSFSGGMVHDIMRGRLSGLIPPAPSECAAMGVSGASSVVTDADCAAPLGDGCWYLVRARDSCGAGPYGAGETVCFDACGGSPVPGCPVCGDGIPQAPREVCDGAALGGETCVTAGYDGGTLGCTQSCTLDTSGCTTICGNGIRRGDEDCDSAVQGAHTCVSLGYAGGILGCAADCRFDVTACCCSVGTPQCPACPICGNGVREAPSELCDGADLGGETCVSRGWASGVLACNQDCTWFDFSACVGFLAEPTRTGR